ncbi:hypothetical protein BHE74_00031275 [Ensete ventricosum]|nr:hypothetical protein BHE74_00031275 [Ensete ventricosum]
MGSLTSTVSRRNTTVISFAQSRVSTVDGEGRSIVKQPAEAAVKKPTEEHPTRTEERYAKQSVVSGRLHPWHLSPYRPPAKHPREKPAHTSSRLLHSGRGLLLFSSRWFLPSGLGRFHVRIFHRWFLLGGMLLQ